MEEARLTSKQETILYSLSLRQDELERSPSFIRVKDIETNPVYSELVAREFLTYQKIGMGDNAIASLIVTLKGMRYCVKYIDEISARVDAANLALSVQNAE